MSNKQLITFFLFLGLFASGTGVIIILFNNQKEAAESITKLATIIQESQNNPKTEVRVIEKVVASQPWSSIQDLSRNTVVQIIAQTSEIDILQPYKTPKHNAGTGSGFFISETGEIVTNSHVVEEATALWIKIPSLGKMIIDVELIGKSPERDLALLRVSPEGCELIKNKLGKIPYLKLGDSDLVNRADEILTLGYPLGQAAIKSTTGIVSGREHIAGHYLIQISSPINPGSSGGPSLNIHGEVIGVTCAMIMGAQNVGYIIPSNELNIILDDLRTTKLLRRPFLGLLLSNASQELATYLGNPVPAGTYVVDVYQGSPIAKAGVKSGDMIYEINGYPVDMYGDLKVPWSEDTLSVVDYVTRLEIGQNVTIIIYRNGERKEIKFKFGFSEPAPVRKIFLGDDVIDYEIAYGMLIQPLTLNHLGILIANAPSLAKYTEFKNQMIPALVVTHLIPNSQVQRLDVVREGFILEEINGTRVQNMQELRSALQQSINKKHVTFKMNNGVFFVIEPQKALIETIKLSKLYQYPISPFMNQLIDSANINTLQFASTE